MLEATLFNHKQWVCKWNVYHKWLLIMIRGFHGIVVVMQSPKQIVAFNLYSFKLRFKIRVRFLSPSSSPPPKMTPPSPGMYSLPNAYFAVQLNSQTLLEQC
jgi:hypothetical protein